MPSSRTLLALVVGGLALAAAAPAAAVEVVSIAHSPSSPLNRFTLQCGRSGLMKTTLLVDAGVVTPTQVLGAVEVAGRITTPQQRSYAQGPAYDATARKVGGRGNRWLLNDAFTWRITCRADCGSIRVGNQTVAGGSMEFRFVAGGEGERREGEPPRFAPRSTAESEVMTLRCEPATPLPHG